MSELTRQDRINLHKNQSGITAGEGTYENLSEGVPQFRTEVDHASGRKKTVQYIKSGLDVVKSEFKNVDKVESEYVNYWAISDELDLTSATGVYKVFAIPAGTYLLDLRILVTSTINAGSMEVDVGDGNDADRYIDCWDGTGGTVESNTIHSFGISSDATEVGTDTGRYYVNADTIDIDINTVATAGKIRLILNLLKNPIT